MLYKTMTAAALAAVLAAPAYAQSSQMDKSRTDTMQQHQSATQSAEKGMTTGQGSTDKSPGAMDKALDRNASTPGSMDKNAATGGAKSSMDKNATADQDKTARDKASMARAGEKKQPGFIQSPEAGDWRASKLIGASVVGPDDNSIGDINELLVAQDGGIDAAVVGVGGFLGIGEKNVAIPFDALNVQRKADSYAIEKISVSFSKEELENAPKFAYNDERSKPATTGANPGGTPLSTKPATPPRTPQQQKQK